jgi:GNAT superfamily N-acetyltransferase
MNPVQLPLLDEDGCRELESELVDRIYDFNVDATGYADGRLIGGAIRNDAGDLIAGYSGHTWGGCCVITHLWVAQSFRGRGLGRQLLESAETEALRRNCRHAIVSTHSFQAPGFYERMGFDPVATVADWPAGHSAAIYRRILPRTPGTMQPLHDQHVHGGDSSDATSNDAVRESV